MVASSWVFTLVCASPQAIIFRVLKHPTKEFYQCTTIDFFEDLAEKHFDPSTNKTDYILGGINTEAWHTIYHTFINTQIFFLPLLIIIISYIKIYSILSLWVYGSFFFISRGDAKNLRSKFLGNVGFLSYICCIWYLVPKQEMMKVVIFSSGFDI